MAKLFVKILEAKKEDGLFSLLIPNQMLFDWHSSRNDGCSYWEKMNSCIEGKSFMVNDAVEERLRMKAARCFSKIAKAENARKKASLRGGFTTMEVNKGEVVLNSTDTLTQQVKCLEERVEQVTKEAMKYKDHCKVMMDVAKVPINQGRSFDEVHKRQKIRKVASVKHGTELALSFVKSFGLSVEKVVLRSPTKLVELTYDLPESSAGCSSSSSTAADGETESTETENVDETLYLLERFGVSDECYHEMTQLFPHLPRLYVVKNERKDISQSVELKELPSKYKGAYRPVRKFIETILSDKVSCMNNNKLFIILILIFFI